MKDEIRQLKAMLRTSQPQRGVSPETYPNARPQTDITSDFSRALEEMRRMQSRIDGFMCAYASRSYRQDQPRMRTRDGRPMCNICGQAGHVRQNCFSQNEQRYSHNRQPSSMNNSRPPPQGSRIAVMDSDPASDPVITQFEHQIPVKPTQDIPAVQTPEMESIPDDNDSDNDIPLPALSPCDPDDSSSVHHVYDERGHTFTLDQALNEDNETSRANDQLTSNDCCSTTNQPLPVSLQPEIWQSEQDSLDHDIQPLEPSMVCTTAPDAPGFVFKPQNLSLQGTIAGISTKLLVDTGASITALNAALYRRLPSLHTLRTTPSPVPMINTVSGEKLPTLGQVTLPLEVASNTNNCKMYVIEDLGFEAVLGRDFLEDKGAVIDLRDRTMQLTHSDPQSCEPITQVVRTAATYV